MSKPARPYTVPELAEHWQCSEQHVYNLIGRGEVPAIRLGRLVRVPRAFVEARDRGESWPESDNSTGRQTGTSSGPSKTKKRENGAVADFRRERALRARQKRP